ncbi:unnamed protein product [Arabidopsis thaliana]|uniref:WIYLD domain-containing protein n=1 Tax=Arabidopsis thaliana TaxID=3702 RepID=A0A178WB74_ARATH|nr:hypothetical protein AXX17_AT1G40920 [Arabidopsis thaliana]CAA0275071.1 unnamed protein product [Arabidopsis thaliana]
MAPKGPKGRKNIGLRREDAARDRMKEFGFKKPVINASIKQVLKVYGEDQWFLIEDANYEVSLIFPLKSKRNKPTDWRPRNTKKQLRKNQKKKSGFLNLYALLITNEAVMDSSPSAFQFVEAPPVDYAHHSVGGAQSSHCGWLSSEEETDPDKDSDEMIQLTPEPLCEELEEILREVYGQKKLKYN